MAPRAIPIEQRFWSKAAQMPTGCWEWRGFRQRDNQGWFTVSRARKTYAHRFAWELTHGSIPAGMVVCHKCDNPPCINPEHLFLGTQRDNCHDAMRKGRNVKGETHGMAILTEAQVSEIRHIAANNPGLRQIDIGAMFGVSKGAVQRIVARKNWKHVA